MSDKKNNWGPWVPRNRNIIELHPEPYQWVITLHLDIDGRKIFKLNTEGLKEYNPEIMALLDTLAERIDTAIGSDSALMSRLKRAGITVVGVMSAKA